MANPFEHIIRVTWGDCDPANIVYTGRLPWFALDAINAWWEANTGHGWYKMENDDNLGTPFVRIEMDLMSPVTPRHPLRCRVWPNRLGDTSVGFRVEASQDDKLWFAGNFVSVFTQADAFKKTQPPEIIREIVQANLIPAT